MYCQISIELIPLARKYETLEHQEKKSGAALFLVGLVPLLNLYLLWKVADVVSGHEIVYM